MNSSFTQAHINNASVVLVPKPDWVGVCFIGLQVLERVADEYYRIGQSPANLVIIPNTYLSVNWTFIVETPPPILDWPQDNSRYNIKTLKNRPVKLTFNETSAYRAAQFINYYLTKSVSSTLGFFEVFQDINNTWVSLQSGKSFSQSQIDAGKVRFHPILDKIGSDTAEIMISFSNYAVNPLNLLSFRFSSKNHRRLSATNIWMAMRQR